MVGVGGGVKINPISMGNKTYISFNVYFLLVGISFSWCQLESEVVNVHFCTHALGKGMTPLPFAFCHISNFWHGVGTKNNS